MEDKNLITQQSTELTLRKATDIINRTNRVLKISKKELVANPDVMTIDGKMWQKETVEEEMTWDEAMEYAKNLRLGGYDDWRLPTIEELEEVVKNCGGTSLKEMDPDIDEENEILNTNKNNQSFQSSYKEKGFILGCYWSSTHYIGEDYFLKELDNISRWGINFYYGSIDGYRKFDSCYVRCVRTILEKGN